MDNNSVFIGVGPNPHGEDLPLGLGLLLAQNPDAMNAFSRLSEAERADLIHYIQGATTGDDAKNRIADTITNLNHGQAHFF